MSQLRVSSEIKVGLDLQRKRRMTSARMNMLATLRGRVDRLETHDGAHGRDKIALGHAGADAMLQGGLARAAVHEVFAAGHQSAAATGFIAGLAGRVTARRPLGGGRPDFT